MLDATLPLADAGLEGVRVGEEIGGVADSLREVNGWVGGCQCHSDKT